jgi:hypothetical protein
MNNLTNYSGTNNRLRARRLNAAAELAGYYKVALGNSNKEKLARVLFHNMKLNNNITGRVARAKTMINYMFPSTLLSTKKARFGQLLTKLPSHVSGNYSRLLNFISKIKNTKERNNAMRTLLETNNNPRNVRLLIAMFPSLFNNQNRR